MTRVALLIALLLLMGCGGGGAAGGGGIAISGRVLFLTSGGPPNPPVTVQAGSRTVQTAEDGTFALDAASGTTTLLIINSSPTSTSRFDFDPLVQATDVGDLWIGPESVNVSGTVADANDNSPIAGAKVTLGGKTATTGENGRYTLNGVAYDGDNLPAFFGLLGRISKDGYLARDFFPNEEAIAGNVTLAEILLAPEGGSTPPPVPFNIEGFVSPTSDAAGTVVVLKLNGTPFRQTTVSSDNRYSFFVPAGTYVATFTNPTNNKSASDEVLVLSAANQVIRKDVTLR